MSHLLLPSLVAVIAHFINVVLVLGWDLRKRLPLEGGRHDGVIRVLAALVQPRDHPLDEIEEFVVDLTRGNNKYQRSTVNPIYQLSMSTYTYNKSHVMARDSVISQTHTQITCACVIR